MDKFLCVIFCALFTAGLCAPEEQASQIFFFLVLLCGGALWCETDRSHGLEKQIEILEEHIQNLKK